MLVGSSYQTSTYDIAYVKIIVTEGDEIIVPEDDDCEGEIPEITEVMQTYWESWSEPYDFSLALSVCLVGSHDYDIVYSWFVSSNPFIIYDYFLENIVSFNFSNGCDFADVFVRILRYEVDHSELDAYIDWLFKLTKTEEGWKIYDKEIIYSSNPL